MGDPELRPVQEDATGKYFVCRNGKVYSKLFCNRPPRPSSTKRERVMVGSVYFSILKGFPRGKERRSPNHYLAVDLRGIGTRSVHRLVAGAFCTKLDDLQVVNHINGTKTDNRAENLEWVSKRQNMKHAMKQGLRRSVDYKNLRLLLETTNMTQSEIAAATCCSVSNVEKFIRNGKVQRPAAYKPSQRMIETRANRVGTKWYRNGEHETNS